MMESTIQIAKRLDKELKKWNYKFAIKHCVNEYTTRDGLVEPFLQILRYKKFEDYTHEYKVKTKSVDTVIQTKKGQKPSIFIECKTLNTSLSGRPYTQLSGYYRNAPEAKIGILTNGTQYHFYSRSLKDPNKLHNNPFFTFDIENYNFSDLEKLSSFDKQSIDIKRIISQAEDSYFLEKFNDGLFKTLYKPKKELIKLIYNNMGFDRLTDKFRKKIFTLMNSISLEESIERIKVAEAKDSKTGILTTSDEIKTFDRIKTIISTYHLLKKDNIDRISYKDYKHSFKIIVDNMPSKEICNLQFKKNKIIEIDKSRYELKNLSANEISKHKKKLINIAKKYLLS